MKEQTGEIIFGKVKDGESLERKNILVIFGAKDYEEILARKIAELAGCTIATATCDGLPVHAGNAYRADGYRLDSGSVMLPEKVIFFECGGKILPSPWAEHLPQIKCDHHNPGDPGYDKGPEEFWTGSSLGQLVDWLSMHDVFYGPDADIYKMTAAGDHCPADAYAGRCPGIDPEEFAEFRIQQKADFLLGINKEMSREEQTLTIMRQINEACGLLRISKEINGIVDLREYGIIPELPEAALKTGKAYMAKIPELGRDRKPTNNDKIVLGGHTTPDQVEQFMAWAKKLVNRVGEPYGNPTRGYAGVVVTLQSCPTCKSEWNCLNIGACPKCGTVYPDESLVG